MYTIDAVTCLIVFNKFQYPLAFAPKLFFLLVFHRVPSLAPYCLSYMLMIFLNFFSPNSSLTVYADGILLSHQIRSSHCLQEVQKDIDLIPSCLSSKFLTINTIKTNNMIVTRKFYINQCARNGGAMYIISYVSTINQILGCNFTDNMALIGNNGAVFVNFITSSSTLICSNSNWNRNQAAHNGGVYDCYSQTPIICVFTISTLCQQPSPWTCCVL